MVKRFTYKQAGVDIDKANVFVKAIQKDVKSTLTKNVLLRKGSFGGLFGLDTLRYKNPVLVSSTDGVGTKLLLAQKHGIHNTVGIDLVAMNVNDILCVGAKPLFFLDYIACGRLDPKILKNVVKGIARGCRESGCSLIGGETAEMPDMYKKDEYDLAGFVVGVVEKPNIIDGSKIAFGDVIIGLPSSGLHSNGFSLVRKSLSTCEQKEFIKYILRPTKIYVKEIDTVLQECRPKAMAHITGGAYFDKLTKVLPKGKSFHIHKESWPVPFIFKKIQSRGKISEEEMYRTFNMGIGLAMVISKKQVASLMAYLKVKNIRAYVIGEVVKNVNKIIL